MLTFREAKDRIRLGLAEIGLEPALLERLMEGVEAGKSGAFTGSGHISAKAARAILPGLATGLVYSDACAEVGYNHAEQAEISLKDIRNPTVQRALAEMLKQVRVLNRSFGVPDLIHVELARDVGKSAEERDEPRLGQPAGVPLARAAAGAGAGPLRHAGQSLLRQPRALPAAGSHRDRRRDQPVCVCAK